MTLGGSVWSGLWRPRNAHGSGTRPRGSPATALGPGGPGSCTGRSGPAARAGPPRPSRDPGGFMSDSCAPWALVGHPRRPEGLGGLKGTVPPEAPLCAGVAPTPSKLSGPRVPHEPLPPADAPAERDGALRLRPAVPPAALGAHVDAPAAAPRPARRRRTVRRASRPTASHRGHLLLTQRVRRAGAFRAAVRPGSAPRVPRARRARRGPRRPRASRCSLGCAALHPLTPPPSAFGSTTCPPSGIGAPAAAFRAHSTGSDTTCPTASDSEARRCRRACSAGCASLSGTHAATSRTSPTSHA